MGTVTLPNVSQVGENAWEDVEGNDRALRDEINGNLENVNVKSTAAIAYSKLATLSTGQLVVGNAGVPTATTLSGDATISAAGALTIGTGAITSAKILDGTIAAGDLASDSVTTAKILDANVTDAKLASPNNSTYKTLLAVSGQVGGVANSTTVYHGYDNSAPQQWATAAAVDIGGSQEYLSTLYFDDADFTVGSLTQKLRLRAQLYTEAAVDAITHTVGLYPISSIANGVFTIGSVIAGSTVAFASPSANTMNQNNSGDFTIPSDGHYVVGIAFSGNHPNAIAVSAQLQTRNTA